MPNYTNNLNLIKPKKSENYDIDEVTNKNMDIIDTEIEKKVNKVPGKGLSTNDFTNEFVKLIRQMAESKKGVTFYPKIDSEGNLSWDNDGMLENPIPVNIKGQDGPKGDSGKGIEEIKSISKESGGVIYSIIYTDGSHFEYIVFDGVTFLPSVDEDGNLSWSNIRGATNPETVNIRGPQGPIGPEGPQGPQGRDGDVAHFSKLEIGNVISGSKASATIRGEEPNQILDLVLPEGPQGQAGASDTIDILFEGEKTNGSFNIRKDLKKYDEIQIYTRPNSNVSFIDEIYSIKINDNTFNGSTFSMQKQLTQIHSGGFIDFITLQISSEDISIVTNYRTKHGIEFVHDSDNPNKIVKIIGIIKNNLSESNLITDNEIDDLFLEGE